MDEALKEHMERTVKPMADELVPKLTGALMETGRVVHGDKELSYSLMETLPSTTGPWWIMRLPSMSEKTPSTPRRRNSNSSTNLCTKQKIK